MKKRVWDFLKRKKHITTWILFGIAGVIMYLYIQTGISILLVLDMIIASIALMYVEFQF